MHTQHILLTPSLLHSSRRSIGNNLVSRGKNFTPLPKTKVKTKQTTRKTHEFYKCCSYLSTYIKIVLKHTHLNCHTVDFLPEELLLGHRDGQMWWKVCNKHLHKTMMSYQNIFLKCHTQIKYIVLQQVKQLHKIVISHNNNCLKTAKQKRMSALLL